MILHSVILYFFKPNTSNLYFLDIFPADMSGELLPAVGGRQDGKEDSVLMKSGYAREVVVTRWLDQRMGQIQTPWRSPFLKILEEANRYPWQSFHCPHLQ